jgi:hypothetical protein
MTGKASWGLTLLVLAVIAMAGLAVLPYVWQQWQQPVLAEQRLELRFLEAKLNKAHSGPKNQLSEADDVTPLFVSGTTTGLAMAEMQGIASQLATANGMTVERLQPLQTDQEDRLATLRMEAEVSGSLDNLRHYLAALESAVPLMFVNRMKIAAPENADAGGDALPSDQLTVTLQLESFGWWEKEQ